MSAIKISQQGALVLEEDGPASVDEQIREHLSEMFDPELYLEPFIEMLHRTIETYRNFIQPLLPESDADRLEGFVTDLIRLVREGLSVAMDDFEIHHDQDEVQPESINSSHSSLIVVQEAQINLKDVDGLVAIVDKPLQFIQKFCQLSDLVSYLLSEIRNVRATFPNFEQRIQAFQSATDRIKNQLQQFEAEKKEKKFLTGEAWEEIDRLRAELEKNQERIADPKGKLERKKKRLSNLQGKLDTIVQTLTCFLAESNGPEGLFDLLDLDSLRVGELSFKPSDLKLDTKVKEILGPGRSIRYPVVLSKDIEKLWTGRMSERLEILQLQALSTFFANCQFC